MDELNEAELNVSTINMFNSGGVLNVLSCLIIMLESTLIILRKLKELASRTGD